MFKRIMLFAIGLMLIADLTAYAQEADPVIDELKSGMISVENPFESKLPQPKLPEPEPVLQPEEIPENPESPNDSTSPEPGEEFPPAEPPIIIEPPVPVRPVPAVVISGVIWDSDRPQAIINGRIVDIGDTIFEIQITKIEKAGIGGIFDGRVVTLKKP